MGVKNIRRKGAAKSEEKFLEKEKLEEDNDTVLFA